jgi:hypothetical protein
MKKLIILMLLLFSANFIYSSETPEGVIEEFFTSGYGLEDECKEVEDFLVALDEVNKYKVISSKIYQEKGVEYSILKVEMESPKAEDLSIKLISEMFKKMGELYLSPEYRPYIKGFMNDSEEPDDKMLTEIFSTFTNSIKNSKFPTEKKVYELYIYKDGDEWTIPNFDQNILYDKKIEKYMKNNGAFYTRYDASIFMNTIFDDFL